MKVYDRFSPLSLGDSTEAKPEFEVLELEDEGSNLVLHNDDVNTFGHVIECLMRYCEHSAEQAEQCAWIVHLNGKCQVKSGTYVDLLPVQAVLADEGLWVTIE